MTTTTHPAPEAYPTTAQLAALSMVGRVVTDGTRVGVLRMVDGPDWVVVTDTSAPRHEWDRSVPPAILFHTPGTSGASPFGEASVRWNGADYLSPFPLGCLTKGVSLVKIPRH